MKKRLILFIAALVSVIGLTFSLCACGESVQSPSVSTEDETLEAMIEKPIEENSAEAPTEEIIAEVKTEEELKPQEEKSLPTFDVPKKEETPLPQKEETPKEEISEEAQEANTCLISVNCDTILKRPDLLLEEKRELLPPDGKILAEREVSFEDGESAFDILLRVLKEEKIHIEFMETPLYDSVYIEGIGNIYEMDCGKLSGWMYKVNGKFLQLGSSAYQPKSGDKIEWVYTCDAGKDISGQ